MTWYLTEPIHYVNQCWLLSSEVLWHSPGSNFVASAPATILHNEFENYIFQITAPFLKGNELTGYSAEIYNYSNRITKIHNLSTYEWLC